MNHLSLRLSQLVWSALTAFSAVCLLQLPVVRPAAAEQCETAPRNVVLIIVDGMHIANEAAASRYLFGTDNGLSFHGWEYSAPVATWDIDTYNANAKEHGVPAYDSGHFDPLVGYSPEQGGAYPELTPQHNDGYFVGRRAADSASSGTALSTGLKTDRGNISWAPGDPADGMLVSITDRLRQRGAAIGIVTTMPFSHATPAAFAAHNPSRSDYHGIAREMLFTTQPDVLIGGGHPRYYGDGRDYRYVTEADLGRLLLSGDCVVARRRSGQNGGKSLQAAAMVAAGTGRRLVGLFGGPEGMIDPPVPVDTPGDPAVQLEEENPQLAESAIAALTVLSGDPDGFFLLLEQGDVDWANHSNDYAWAVGAMWDAHAAARAVVDWIDRPGDSVTMENTLVVLLPDHTLYLRLTATLGPGELPEQIAVEDSSTDPWEYYWRYPGGEVVYKSRSHTNELGMLYATGAGAGAVFADYEGSWYPDTRIIDNTHVHDALIRWLDLE